MSALALEEQAQALPPFVTLNSLLYKSWRQDYLALHSSLLPHCKNEMFQYSWNETFWHYQNARRRLKLFIWTYSHKNVTEISTFSQHVFIWAKRLFPPPPPLENDFIKNKWPFLITTHWAFAPKVKAIKTALSLYVLGDRFSLTGCYEKQVSLLQKSWYLMSLGLQAKFISCL